MCNNVNCTVHNHDICGLYHKVIDECLKAGECIPSTALPKQNNIVGWDDLLKHIRGNPTSIDNASADDDIVNLFVDKYSNLYNSVPYDQIEINDIK